jgi:Tol biopolymer transport system component
MNCKQVFMARPRSECSRGDDASSDVIAQSGIAASAKARLNAGVRFCVARNVYLHHYAAHARPHHAEEKISFSNSLFHPIVSLRGDTMPVIFALKALGRFQMQYTLVRNAAALLLACAAALFITPAFATGSGAIVFSQPQVNADGSLRSDSLSLASTGSSAIQALTSATDSVVDDGASWSPDGTRIVFERGTPRGRNAIMHFDLFSMDARTLQGYRLTLTAGSFTSPVWGPRNRIAFVSRYVGKRCLSVIEENGRQRDLFCPPSPAELMRPMWSADGKYLYLHAGYETGGLEPLWRSLAYRVDSTTGAPFVLDDRILDESARLAFSPDGLHGIFYNYYPYTAAMSRIDFATGAMTPLADGYAPHWSPDGRRIAYTSEVYANMSDGWRYFEPLYVMDADGSHARRLTTSTANNHAYIAAQWSRDNVHLLVNRRDYLDPSLTLPRYGLRIVNADTGSLRSLSAGFADAGAWFER